ncbi:DUF768 domain-containing protein [Bradyrhizobium sp. Leo170]|uniref:DUF768 domain-containing protein n=1 Tax=Bradyrhizobium sp. Leo170 TaxID=1571199 RepID=UPI00102EBE0C|nr:DUF768 domain-containing protein [Bradyrhizobium sp. Leo170]TAI63661.1 hypothetical protein CWO89_23075 [Bradyrhizobium sp. Leo170]
MSTKARAFIDFWIENSVHASEQPGTVGASQDVEELTTRCREMAKHEGISEQSIRDEIGDLTEYIRSKLDAANMAEKERQQNAPK